MKVLADMHTHSDNSPDGNHSVMLMVESAVQKGLQYYAITDHCEMQLFYKDNFSLAVKQSYFDIQKAANIFRGQIQVITGIELGQPTADIELSEKLLNDIPYDFVLGSTHYMPGMDDFCFLDYNKYNPTELFEKYLAEELRLAKWGGFDVLAHLTYPLRYIEGEFGYPIDIKKYEGEITQILKELIAKGKGLEINTSGLRQKLGRTMPDLWCVKLFRKLGGKIITFGSDSHFAEVIGANIEDGMKLAKEAGFNTYCIYQERKPVFLPLE